MNEKMRKLEDDLRKNDLHNLFNLVREIEGKPKKVL